MSEKDSKKIIMDVATHMFYDIGYTSTSMVKISKLCDMTYMGVSYHYNNKERIADIIQGKFMQDIRNYCMRFLMEKFGHQDLRLCVALETRVMREHYRRNANYRKFFVEYTRSTDLLLKSQMLDFYRLTNNTYNLGFNEHEIKLITTLAQASLNAITLGYYDEFLDCDYDEYIDLIITHALKGTFDDDSLIKALIEESRKIFSTMYFDILPYFEVN